MKKSFSDASIRSAAGFDSFVESIKINGEIKQESAEKVAKFYIKNKLAKSDFSTGRYTIKHGALFDKDVIANAVSLANK